MALRGLNIKLAVWRFICRGADPIGHLAKLYNLEIPETTFTFDFRYLNYAPGTMTLVAWTDYDHVE